MRLVRQAENYDAGIVGGRVRQYVGEFQVQRDEGALLSAADVNDALVRLTAKRLLDDGVGIVPSRFKHRRQCRRQILVISRSGQVNTLARQLGRVRHRSRYVIFA